ncbi:MAG: phosphoglucomutase/phosphomannomutase family protein [Brevibacillus sp.]|nr:phosphoglucomutase/phosphomannomutase family protein [Brevibacillus sp.]
MADSFTMENVRIVAQAIASDTCENNREQDGVIVGYDTRFMGRRFAEQVVQVLAANGIRCCLVREATPTPVVAFGVKHFALSGAVMITASHNAPEYNGIKYIPDYAGPAAPAVTAGLEERIREIVRSGHVKRMTLAEAESSGLVEPLDVRPHYADHVRRLIRFDVLKEAGLSIVVDPMHGAGIGYVSQLLKEAGVHTIGIRETVDPLFGGAAPEPIDKNLTVLKAKVLASGADLGLANDGDADRFGVVDHLGRYISPNKVLALLARHLVKNRGWHGRIVRTAATSHLLDRIAERYGLPLTETAVGFKYIGAEMLKGDVLIGGEESGGCSIQRHIPEKDGILTNLLIAEMCAWERKKLDQILSDMHEDVGELFDLRMDRPFSMGKGAWERTMECLPDRVGPFRVLAVDRRDGVKLLLEGGRWMLLRPSGTEPLLRIYLEAASKTELQILTEAVDAWFTGAADMPYNGNIIR